MLQRPVIQPLAKDSQMSEKQWKQVKVIDSHTGGEPTRIIIEGGPDLGTGSMTERRQILSDQFGDFCSSVISEPRASNVWVGGLLCQPVNPEAATGIIYFNSAGVINMCGHGTIGLGVSLLHMGRIKLGQHRIETPVGEVVMNVHGKAKVSVKNVASYRYQSAVELTIAGVGRVTGDIAWGGNWFFLVRDHDLRVALDNVANLERFAGDIRSELTRQGLTGEDDGEIDHIQLYGPGQNGADSQNFVLCPSGAYDRSPCGTGTSAKVACLMADGKLEAGQTWRQQSIVGSVFEVCGKWDGPHVLPEITVWAYVTAESTLQLDPDDPFRAGIR